MRPPPLPLDPLTPPPHRRHGFSLVEVTLAVGITASALLIIFALIPVGLSTLQDTGRQIVETEIFDKIGSELATTAAYGPPSATASAARTNLLLAYCNDSNRFPAFFDAEGNEVKPAAAAAAALPPVFTVRCTYGDGSGNPRPTSAVWTPANDGELLSVTVSVGYHQSLGTSPTPSPTVRQRTFLLANHGN